LTDTPFISDRNWERLLTVVTPALLLGAAGLGSIAGGGGQRYFGYMLAGGALFVFAGALLGFFSLLLPRALRLLLLAVILTLALDIAFGWMQVVITHVRELLPEAQNFRRGTILLAAFGIPIGLVFALRRRIVPILVAVSLGFAISCLVLPAGAQPGIGALIEPTRPQRPLGRVLLHILLDAHIGPSGIPATVAGADMMRRQIADFYVSRGYRLYSSAYSPYPTTVYSLPAFFTLEDPSPVEISPDALAGKWAKPLAWFEKLHRDGYAVHAYSIGSLVDLCASTHSASFASCQRYGAEGINLTLWKDDPYRRILIYTGRRSFLMQQMCALVPSCNSIYWVDLGRNLRSVQVLDRVVEAVHNASGDVAIFAHILLPHSPQLLGANCQPDFPVPYDNSSADLFYRRYFGQVQCTQSYIARIEQALVARNALQNATIIVHGDHGIGPLPQGRDAAHWRAPWHSTLFAIRTPGLAPGLDGGLYRAQSLFAAFASGRAPRPGDGAVWDMDINGRPTVAHIDPSQLILPSSKP